MLIKDISSYEDFEEYLEKYNNIIVNISAKWCKPCQEIKIPLNKYINVIKEDKCIYLKLDNEIYETDDRFNNYFNMKKIPYFIFIINKEIKESFVSSDFMIISKKIYDFINENNFTNNTDF
jgi:thiol-disulfide isomerase/thioredoxin